jgi:hypothetical protein
MWPIVFGFVLGASAHAIYWHMRSDHSVLGPSYEPEEAAARRKALLDLLWLGLAAAFIVAVFAAWYATTLLDGIGGLGGLILGLCTGAICASWYRDAGRGGNHVTSRGIAVGIVAAVVFLAGLNNEHRIFDRVKAFSTSVVTLEFERTPRSERPEVNANTPPGQGSTIWAADEAISFALLVAEDIATKALGRDEEALRHVSGLAPGALLRANEPLLKTHIAPLVVLRGEAHKTKRDSSPVYFDTSNLDQIKLALALRNLVAADMVKEDFLDATRDDRAASVAMAFREYYASTHRSACLFARLDVIENLKDEEARLKLAIDQAKPAAKAAKERDLLGVQAKLKAERSKAQDACWMMGDAQQRDKRLDDEEKAFRSAIPDKHIVQSTPYVTILAASLLLGGSEREAAISLLDHWWRAAERRAKDSGAERERVFNVRVLNLIGLLLSNRSNAVHMELNWHYQQAALDESTAFIAGIPLLQRYADAHKFADHKSFDLLSSAGLPASDRRNACAGDGSVSEGGRYFIFRRSTLLNNSVYFLSMQHDLLELGRMADKFDDLIDELRSVRVDCLSNLSGAKPKVSAEWEKLRAGILSSRLETLARGFATQAWLKRNDARAAKRSLCEAHRAATLAERLAEAEGDQLLLSRKTFFERPFDELGKAIVGVSDIRNTRRLIRDLDVRLRVYGDGACIGSDGTAKR